MVPKHQRGTVTEDVCMREFDLNDRDCIDDVQHVTAGNMLHYTLHVDTRVINHTVIRF